MRLNAVAASLCDGSLTPLLEHLVEAHKLTQDRVVGHQVGGKGLEPVQEGKEAFGLYKGPGA